MACARAIVEGAKEHDLEVRGGIHTGECELVGEKIAGIAVDTGLGSRRSRHPARCSSRAPSRILSPGRSARRFTRRAAAAAVRPAPRDRAFDPGRRRGAELLVLAGDIDSAGQGWSAFAAGRAGGVRGRQPRVRRPRARRAPGRRCVSAARRSASGCSNARAGSLPGPTAGASVWSAPSAGAISTCSARRPTEGDARRRVLHGADERAAGAGPPFDAAAMRDEALAAATGSRPS